MTKQSEHLAARRMRAAGATYREIAAALGVSISSVSLWTRDLPAPTSPLQQATRRENLRRFRERDRAAREAARQERRGAAYREIGEMTRREVLLVGTALYWAEGAKSKPWALRERLRFVNSDPDVIRVFLVFLSMLGAERSRLKFSLSIHADADVASALKFWSAVVNVPVQQFQRTALKRHHPRTVRRNCGEHYHGCLTVDLASSAGEYQGIEGRWQGIVQAIARGDSHVSEW